MRSDGLNDIAKVIYQTLQKVSLRYTLLILSLKHNRAPISPSTSSPPALDPRFQEEWRCSLRIQPNMLTPRSNSFFEVNPEVVARQLAKIGGLFISKIQVPATLRFCLMINS